METESWVRNHGATIVEETSGEIWKPSWNNLGSVWEALRTLQSHFHQHSCHGLIIPIATKVQKHEGRLLSAYLLI